MQRQIWKLMAIGMLLFYLLSLRVSATPIQSIYVFGDSLSDTGNVFQTSLLVAGTGLPAPPYFQGRFCDGYLWIDYLAEQLQLPITPVAQLQSNRPKAVNFAYGGATTSGRNIVNAALPGLDQEIEQFKQLQSDQKADSHALYMLWIGSNDYLPRGESSALPDPARSAENISSTIRSLYELGARRFLVANLPNLGEIPLARSLGQETVLTLNRLSQQHNQWLDRQLNGLQQSLSSIDLMRLDVSHLFDQAISGQLYFTDTKTPCLDRATKKTCVNPEQHLFWDKLHPTTAAHRYVADLAVQQINSQMTSHKRPYRLPMSMSGLVVLGSVSLIAAFLWRGQQGIKTKSR